MAQVVGFSGSPSRPSKTRALVTSVAEAIGDQIAADARVFDLLDLGPSWAMASRLDDLDMTARAAVDSVLGADVLIVGSPVYKAAYAGMFKHFFDLLPPDSLAGKLVCLTATGGSERHALVIEQHMRPLFSFFCSVTLPTGIFATDKDFQATEIVSDNVRERVEAAAYLMSPALTPAARTPRLIASSAQ